MTTDKTLAHLEVCGDTGDISVMIQTITELQWGEVQQKQSCALRARGGFSPATVGKAAKTFPRTQSLS